MADGSVYAQIAVSGSSCSTADAVAAKADSAKGKSYTADGFSCSATAEGSGSSWASAWGGTYYAYSCADGERQVAFNWGTDYTYDSGSGGSTPSPSAASSASGALQPTPLGEGDCHAGELSGGSVYAQIAVSNTSCSVADAVAEGAAQARGVQYQSQGFSCRATAEGSGSPWAGAWGGTYYAYSCADGDQQVAFNWGTDYTY